MDWQDSIAVFLLLIVEVLWILYIRGFLRFKKSHNVPPKLDGKLLTAAILSILATLGYFFMLIYSLLNASYPPFAELFSQILLEYNAVPIGIWSFWFGVSVSGVRV